MLDVQCAQQLITHPVVVGDYTSKFSYDDYYVAPSTSLSSFNHHIALHNMMVINSLQLWIPNHHHKKGVLFGVDFNACLDFASVGRGTISMEFRNCCISDNSSLTNARVPHCTMRSLRPCHSLPSFPWSGGGPQMHVLTL